MEFSRGQKPHRTSHKTFADHKLGNTDLMGMPPTFTLFSCLAYSSNRKKKATYSSETLFDFQRTTWRYISEDRIIRVLNRHMHTTL
jgi:hypothetical protein